MAPSSPTRPSARTARRSPRAAGPGALLLGLALLTACADPAPGGDHDLLAASLAPAPAPVAADGLAPDLDPLIAGAVAAVDPARLEDDLTTLVGFGTRHTRSETGSQTRGIGAARRWLHARFKEISEAHGGRLGLVSEKHLIPAGRRMPEATELVNVVAELRGSDPRRVVIVSGHYDSRNSTDADVTGDAPGANDDGSGTVAVLEAARVICAALGDRTPRATIRFACVAGEEQGLYGSRAMAAADRAAGRDVTMLTNDIMGGVSGGNGRPNRGLVRLFSEGLPSSELADEVTGSDSDATSRQLARALELIGERYVPSLDVRLVFRQDRYLRGGDHKAFNEQGYPAVRFTDMYEHFDRQHQDVRVEDGREYGDTLEHIDWVNLADVTRVNVAGVLELALAPPPPTDVRVDVSALSHHTRLVWDDPGDDDVAGYLIYTRDTTAPQWQAVIELPGHVHEHVLEGVSKDDTLFAVAAVGRDGHRSLMVYPSPGR